MKYMREKLRSITSVVFSFLLTLLIFILFLNAGICFGVFTNRSIIGTLNDTKYFDGVYTDIQTRVQVLLTGSGMPVNVFDEVLNEKRIYVGCNNYVNNTLHKEVPQINSDKLVNELRIALDSYLEADTSQQAKPEDKSHALISTVEKIYSDGVRLKLVDSIMELRARYAVLLKYLYPVVVFLIIICCFCLFRLHKYKHRSLRYINYSMLAASILLIAVSAGALLNKGYEQLAAEPAYYHNFIVSYSRLNIQACLYTGVFGLLLSAVLIYFTSLIKYQYFNK